MTLTQEKKNIRTLQGIVTSDAMDKTIAVIVKRTVLHPRYRKRYTRTKKYFVHDPQNRFHVGDAVSFHACRPFSRRKRWMVIYPQA